MDRIKTISITLFFIVCSSTIILAERTDEFNSLLEKYKSQYNFFSIPDSLYTIESELTLPENYSYVEYEDTLGFPYWVSHFPIWHQYKAIGHWKGTKLMEYDEVSRAIHLPWSGPTFKDAAIPIRILGEYYFQTNNRFALEVYPKKGKILTYADWLKGKPAFNQHSELFLKDEIQREESEEEYYLYLVLCMQNIDYLSLAKSCEVIDGNDIQAGDIYIATDEKGKSGRVLIVFKSIINKDGEIMYLLANGCPDACDLHVPKFNEDRDNPWITLEQLQELTKEYENRNFYRFHIKVNDNSEK